MLTLSPFTTTSNRLILNGKAQKAGSKIILSYHIRDPLCVLNLPSPFSATETSIGRKDNLWKTTCFEFFLKQKDSKSYYEFNFSLDKSWNQYLFDSYRQPQPPRYSFDFKLKKMSWNGHTLDVQLDNVSEKHDYEYSLTAVLQETNNAIHYMALKHTDSVANFHHVDSYLPLPSAN